MGANYGGGNKAVTIQMGWAHAPRVRVGALPTTSARANGHCLVIDLRARSDRRAPVGTRRACAPILAAYLRLRGDDAIGARAAMRVSQAMGRNL